VAGNSAIHQYATAAVRRVPARNVAVLVSQSFPASESQGGHVSWFANNPATNWPCAKAAGGRTAAFLPHGIIAVAPCLPLVNHPDAKVFRPGRR